MCGCFRANKDIIEIDFTSQIQAADCDCGICDDFNQSCLTEIFLDGPIQINAYINNNMVELSWNQINYPENQAILGFNIYRNENYLASTVNEQFLIEEFNDGEFCIAAFDQYNNEN